MMDSQTLKDMQAPLKQQYRERPESAVITLKASGAIGEGLTCRVETGKAMVEAGLQPATSGNGLSAPCAETLLGKPGAFALVTSGAGSPAPCPSSSRRTVRRL